MTNLNVCLEKRQIVLKRGDDKLETLVNVRQ